MNLCVQIHSTVYRKCRHRGNYDEDIDSDFIDSILSNFSPIFSGSSNQNKCSKQRSRTHSNHLLVHSPSDSDSIAMHIHVRKNDALIMSDYLFIPIHCINSEFYPLNRTNIDSQNRPATVRKCSHSLIIVLLCAVHIEQRHRRVNENVYSHRKRPRPLSGLFIT